MFEQMWFSTRTCNKAFWSTAPKVEFHTSVLCPCDVLQKYLPPVVPVSAKLLLTFKANQEITTSEKSSLTPFTSGAHLCLSLGLNILLLCQMYLSLIIYKLPNLFPMLDLSFFRPRPMSIHFAFLLVMCQVCSRWLVNTELYWILL